MLKALKERAKPKAPARPLLGQGLPAVLAVVEALRAHPAAEQVSEAGSVRRRRETFRDLDIIATATDAKALIDAFTGFDWVAEVAAKGGTKATVISHEGLRFDLRVVPPECYGNLLQHFTGSKEHNVAMREEAQRRGLSISEYGDHRGRVAARCTRSRPRRSCTSGSATSSSRPSCARPPASWRRHGAASCRRSSRRAICAATCTRTRPGRRTARATMEEMALAAKARGILVPRDHRPLALPARGAAGGAGEGARRR